MLKLLEGLNDAQQRAVTSTAPVILCLAGAGSGKTRALTHRVAYLHQEHRVGTSNMLCLTFTRLAGKEAKERIMALIGEGEGRKLFCNTFHAFAVSVLREWGEKIGLDEYFSIYDQEDRESILQAIIEEFGSRTTVGKVLPVLLEPGWKDETACPEEARVAKEYRYQLQQNNAIDLDGLIPAVNNLWKTHHDILDHYWKTYTHVFVDEFQDTNDEQMEMIQLLNPENLFVVGDDFQNIYTWRGAKIEYILTFSDRYVGCEVVKLEDNYRSTQEIVAAANNLISHNTRQTKKTLRAHKDGEKIKSFRFPNEQQEFKAVIDAIDLMCHKGESLSDIAVLARTNSQIDRIKGLMDELGVPALRVSGRDDPFKKRDIKALLNWLDYLNNLQNISSLKKVLAADFPRRYITRFQFSQIGLLAMHEGVSLDQVVFHRKISGIDLSMFKSDLKELETDMETAEYRPSACFKALINHFMIGEFYRTQKLKNRIRDAEQAYRQIIRWEQSKEEAGEDYSLSSFLRWLRYRDIQEKLILENEDAVRLMTVHAAKGLEFGTVFVIGLAQGLFPSQRTEEVEEERRLCYVALTRAKDQLYITWPKQIETWGGRILETKQSQFLAEVTAPRVERQVV